MSKTYSVGIRIEGIGQDATKSGGIVWYYGEKLTAAQKAASTYEWIGGEGSKQGLIRPPDNVSSDVDPTTADLRLGAHTFRLHWESLAVGLLLAPPALPQESLEEGLTIGETAIKLSDGFDAGDNGETAWFGDECVRLGTYNGSDEFNACTRAYWGTRERIWFNGISAYKRNPSVLHRQVHLLRFDHDDDSVEIIDRLFLEDIESSADGTALVLRCRDLLSALGQARVNRGAPDIATALDPNGHSGPILRIDTDQAGVMSLTGNIGPERIRVKGKLSSNDWGAFQVGESVYFAKDSAQQRLRFEDYDGWVSRAILGGPEPDPEKLAPIYEVVVVDRERDEQNVAAGNTSDVRSATAGLTYPFHPIALSMCYFRSTNDGVADYSTWNAWAGEFMGLEIDDDWFDLVDIAATIERTANKEIDYYIAGYDGEEIVPWEELRSLCRAYGFFPAKTDVGQLTIKPFRDANIVDVATAPGVTAIPFTLHWKPSRADSVDVISGKFGELPWREGRPFVVQHVKRSTQGDDALPIESRRQGLFAQVRELNYDMPTRREVGALTADLVTLAMARHLAAPRLRVLVEDQGFGHGELVRLLPLDLAEPWIVDNDGTLVEIDTTSAKWLGLVVGKRRMLMDGTAAVELLLTNHGSGLFARLRAPSGELSQLAQSTSMSFTQGAFKSTGDGSEFTIGDVVRLWSESGAPRTNVTRTLVGKAAHSVTVNSALPVDGQPGDIIRLAELGSYPETGNPNLYPGFLAYSFFGDDQNEVGPNDLEGHIYGQGGA